MLKSMDINEDIMCLEQSKGLLRLLADKVVAAGPDAPSPNPLWGEETPFKALIKLHIAMIEATLVQKKLEDNARCWSER